MDNVDVLAIARRIKDISSNRQTGWEDLDRAATIIRHQVTRIDHLEKIVQNAETSLLYLYGLFGKVH